MVLVRSVQSWYRGSLIHRAFSSIKKAFSRAFTNSFFRRFFNRLEVSFEKSLLVSLVVGVFGLLDRIFEGLAKFNQNYLLKSSSLGGLDTYTKSISQAFGFFYMTLIGFALVLGLFSLFTEVLVKVRVLLGLVLAGLFGIFLINGKEVGILKGSRVLGFVVSIFEEDKEGEKWW